MKLQRLSDETTPLGKIQQRLQLEMHTVDDKQSLHLQHIARK